MATPLDRIARALEPSMRRAFFRAIEQTRGDLPLAELVDLIERRDLTGLYQHPAWAQLLARLDEGTRGSLEAAITRGASTFRANFQVQNDSVQRAIDTQAAALITHIGTQQRRAIRTLVERAFTEGIPPRALARRIRDHIGLLPLHEVALANFRAAQAARGVPAGTAAQREATYARRLLRFRSEMIARTELLTAANVGQRLAWQQAHRDGTLNLMSRTFLTGDGQTVDGPPAHPQCRCTLVLQFTEDGVAVPVWIVTRDDRLCPICAPIPTLEANQVAGLGKPASAVRFGERTPRRRSLRPRIPA